MLMLFLNINGVRIALRLFRAKMSSVQIIQSQTKFFPIKPEHKNFAQIMNFGNDALLQHT